MVYQYVLTFLSQSKWSIILDCAFQYHCCLSELRVSDIMQYIIFVAYCKLFRSEAPFSVAASSMLSILDDRDASRPLLDSDSETGLYSLLVANAPMDNYLFLDSKYVPQTIDTLLEWCNMIRKTSPSHKTIESFQIYEQLRALRVRGRKIFNRPSQRQTFLQGASLFGFLPLKYVNTSFVKGTAQKNLSQLITRTPIHSCDPTVHVTPTEEICSLFKSATTFLEKHVSNQASEIMVQNIINARTSTNAKKDTYFYISQKERVQHFFQVKKESSWKLKIFRPPARRRRAASKTATLTGWKDENPKFLHWNGVTKDNGLTKESKLMIPVHICQEFFE